MFLIFPYLLYFVILYSVIVIFLYYISLLSLDLNILFNLIKLKIKN